MLLVQEEPKHITYPRAGASHLPPSSFRRTCNERGADAWPEPRPPLLTSPVVTGSPSFIQASTPGPVSPFNEDIFDDIPFQPESGSQVPIFRQQSASPKTSRSAVSADPPANPVFSSPPKTILERVTGPVEPVQRAMFLMKDQGILMTRTAPQPLTSSRPLPLTHPVSYQSVPVEVVVPHTDLRFHPESTERNQVVRFLNGVEVDPVNALGTYQNIYDSTSKKNILNAIESDLAHREQYRKSGHWEIHAHSSRGDGYQNIIEGHPHSKVLSSVETDGVEAEVQNLGTRSSRGVLLVEGKQDAVTNSGAYQNIYDTKSKKIMLNAIESDLAHRQGSRSLYSSAASMSQHQQSEKILSDADKSSLMTKLYNSERFSSQHEQYRKLGDAYQNKNLGHTHSNVVSSVGAINVEGKQSLESAEPTYDTVERVWGLGVDDLPEGWSATGIKFWYSPNKQLKVVGLMPGTGAEHSDLMVGDVIVAVDGESVLSLEPKAILRRINGPFGTQVKVETLRGFSAIVLRDVGRPE